MIQEINPERLRDIGEFRLVCAHELERYKGWTLLAVVEEERIGVGSAAQNVYSEGHVGHGYCDECAGWKKTSNASVDIHTSPVAAPVRISLFLMGRPHGSVLADTEAERVKLEKALAEMEALLASEQKELRGKLADAERARDAHKASKEDYWTRYGDACKETNTIRAVAQEMERQLGVMRKELGEARFRELVGTGNRDKETT